MAVYILQPWAFALLALVSALWWLARYSSDPLSPGRRLGAVALRTLIAALIVTAMADIRLQLETQKRVLIELVDVSRSVADNAILARDALAGDEGSLGETFAVREKLAFAGTTAAMDAVIADVNQALAGNPAESGAASEPGESRESAPETGETAAALGATSAAPDAPLDPRMFQRLDRDRTDLIAAARAAQARIPSGYVPQMLIYSDGRSLGDLEQLATELATAGIRADIVPVEQPDAPEVLVKTVSAPSRVRKDEPFTVKAEVTANKPSPAKLRIYRQGILAGEQDVELDAGLNRFDFEQNAGDDRVASISVEVITEEDTIADNNRLETLVQTTTESRVLLITDDPRQTRFLALALRQQGISLEVRPPTGIPLSLSDLENYDLMMIANVPASAFSPGQMTMVARYVSDLGGGFLMIGGEESFGLGGYALTPIDDILPVKSSFEREKENPSLGLALVIDKSGSMNGVKMEMAKEAARAAIELLSPNDFAGVVVFDGQAFWAAELQQVTDKYGLANLISTIQPGGGTSIAPAMELAYSQLALSSAKIKHVILLTDGHSQPGPFYELTSQMVQSQITVSAVGVGTSADVGLLEQIARWGNGRFYFTQEAQSIPQIFAKETMTASKSAIKELPFQAIATRSVPFLEGIDMEFAPFLYGYVMTEPKPTAEVWLITERGEPLLASWRFGLGTVAAFTSDTRNRWAVEWLNWPGFGKFWAQTLRRFARPQSLNAFPAEIAKSPDGVKTIAVDTIDNRGNLLTGLTATATIIRPDGETEEISLEETAPGRLEAPLEATSRGNTFASIILRDESGDIVDRVNVTHSEGYPPEFQLDGIDEDALRTLAERTGGTFDAKREDVLRADDRIATREIPLWPFLLATALGLFLGDVAVRRWPLRR